MAYKVSEELSCPSCTKIYTDPVTLTCGHSFCRLCITRTWDRQEESEYSCPECGLRFWVRPDLKRNLRLSRIIDIILPTEVREINICCTYCIQSPVPAAKTCLLCEASLCEDHLTVHSNSAEHVLVQPTTTFRTRKCPKHKDIMGYYCCEDATCICVSCILAGEHRGHQVETLNEASKKKKESLRGIMENLTSQREEAEKRVQRLEELRRQVQGKAAGVTERVTALIRDIRKQLEALEKRVLSEISRQEEQVSCRISDLIRQLEIKKEELSRKMGDIEEWCDITDPLTVLQEQESERDEYCDVEGEDDIDIESYDAHTVGHMDMSLILLTLHTGLAHLLAGGRRHDHVSAATDMLLNTNSTCKILLDTNTAATDVSISGDLKTASWSEIFQNRPETTERFQDYPQVLSTSGFSTGQHYWEVEGSESGAWLVGVAYPSIHRKSPLSYIGNNMKSWGLDRLQNQYLLRHGSVEYQIPLRPSCQRIGIYLDYEAGRLSFYELCYPVRHLNTFKTTFTEPLHAVFCVWSNSWLRLTN